MMNKHLFSFIVSALCLIFSSGLMAQTTNWREVYKVKKKDTIYGIANQFGISIPDLVKANPEMAKEGYTLKKGDILYIPNVGEKPKASQTKQETQSSVVKVGIMLPLHNNDGDGLRMVEYYRGFLLAVDQLKQEGLSVDVKSWNVPQDADIRNILLQDGAKECNIIFGPLYTKQVSALSGFCKTYNIKLVIPFSIESSEVNSNSQIFQIYQPSARVLQTTAEIFVNRFKNFHPILIDCNDPSTAKGEFTKELRKQLDKNNIVYSLTNINSPSESFAKAFDRVRPNIVILNASSSPKLNEVFTKLDFLTSTNPNLKISMFGHTEWLMYEKYDIKNFKKYDVYIPSTYYYNPTSERFITFNKAYKSWFHTDMMQQYIPRFAITGFDHAEYFLRGYRKFGQNFIGSPAQSTYQPIQTPLHFGRIPGGGMINQNFQLIHYTDSKIETIVY